MKTCSKCGFTGEDELFLKNKIVARRAVANTPRLGQKKKKEDYNDFRLDCKKSHR